MSTVKDLHKGTRHNKKVNVIFLMRVGRLEKCTSNHQNRKANLKLQHLY